MLPTLAELARAVPPADIDGVSVAPRLLGKDQEQPDRILYWETIPQGRGGAGPWSQTIRWGNWKAIRQKPHLPIELYDLSQDIGETNNIAAQQPDVVRRIESFFKTERSVSRTYPPEVPSWGYPRLETGYVK